MSEPVQVREGVWLTRDGEHVEVRARRGRFKTQFQWIGLLFGVLHLWRNDGRFSGERDHHCDLVEYLGPLPEAEPEATPQQTTTDTLAEIEGQTCETLQEALGQALERAHIDDMRRVIDALTAERDSLQQQLATMTAERDILAQRLMTKPSEEALQKQLGRQQIEINTLKDRLADMTTDRDQWARELLRVTADRDNLLQLRDRLQETLREQRQAIESARAVQQQLAAMTSDRDRLQARVRDLEIEIDAIGQQPAPADKSEQIERIWDDSRERAVSEIIELVIPLQVATGTHAESVLQILPAVIRRWMDGGGCDDAE